MGFRNYLFLGAIFIVAAGLIAYNFNSGEYSLTIGDINLTLPVAVWVILPVFLLYLATLFHMMFYGTLSYARQRRLKKESNKFVEAAKNALLGKEVTTEFKSDIFKLPVAILPLLNFDPKRYASYRIYDDEIQDALEAKMRVLNGEVVDLSKFSLRPDNALVLKNLENKLKSDPQSAEQILRHPCLDKELCEKAMLAFASYAKKEDLKRFKFEPTKAYFDLLVERIGASKNPLDLSDDEIIDYIRQLDFTPEDFIALAKKLKTRLNPDRMIMLFEKLVNEFPHTAAEAYLFVMFEYQMIDKVRDFLDNASEDEYPKYRYLLALKDAGRNFDIELFV